MANMTPKTRRSSDSDARFNPLFSGGDNPSHATTPSLSGSSPESSVVSSSGSSSHHSSGYSDDPPAYDDVPDVHPPEYVDNEEPPSYAQAREERRRERRERREAREAHESHSERESDGDRTDVATSINNTTPQMGWPSVEQMDSDLRRHRRFFRSVLTYLRSDAAAVENEDIIQTVEYVGQLYRTIDLSIRNHYQADQLVSLAEIQGRHRDFLAGNPSATQRLAEFIQWRRARLMIAYRIRRESEMRLHALENLMNQISQERLNISHRTIGLQRW